MTGIKQHARIAGPNLPLSPPAARIAAHRAEAQPNWVPIAAQVADGRDGRPARRIKAIGEMEGFMSTFAALCGADSQAEQNVRKVTQQPDLGELPLLGRLRNHSAP